MKQVTFEDVKDILTETARAIDWSSLHEENDLEEYGLDSLDKASFVMKLEAKAGITIPDDDYEDLKTAQAFIGYIADNRS